MLARAEMPVVFVPGEKISLGNSLGLLTAGKMPKSFGYGMNTYKSATVTEPLQKCKGWNEVNPTSEKPKLMVGALSSLELNEEKDRSNASVDR